MSGAATLVPPNTNQFAPPVLPKLSYTATPVAGSATAATSLIVRRAQAGSCCHEGLAMYAEQPLPAPLHTVSVRRVPSALRVSDVPPTAVSVLNAAGAWAPNPLSPELAVIATPGWL